MTTESYFPEVSRRPKTSVIGAAGFIGRRLVHALSSAGLPVEGFTRRRPFLSEGRMCPSILDSEVIFYLAGRISPALAERDPRLVAEDHRDFGALLRGLKESRHHPVVVLASSGGTVYAPGAAPPYTEDSPTGPVSAYGVAKLRQEEELAASAGWTAPVILRLANVYGPGQKTGAGYGVIGHWIEALLEGRPVRILGDPDTCRDYVHVADVAESMLAVHRLTGTLRAAGTVPVLNIGAGTPTSLAELHAYLEMTVGQRIAAQREPARGFDRRDVWLDIRQAARTIGWKPRIPLLDGLADTWQARPGATEVRRAPA